MPKYWGKQIFRHGRFPEVGQKQKTEREKEREKPPWPKNALGLLNHNSIDDRVSPSLVFKTYRTL